MAEKTMLKSVINDLKFRNRGHRIGHYQNFPFNSTSKSAGNRFKIHSPDLARSVNRP